MMKKYLIVLLMLAMASYASAAAVWLQVDPGDAKSSYAPSDIITIELVADFAVAGVHIGQINGLPTAGPINGFHTNFTAAPNSPGTLVNDGVALITNIDFGVAVGGTAPAAGATLWSFEYHVPDLPESSYITIDDYTLMPTYTAINNADYSIYLSDVGPLEIHVTPEPMTIALLGLGGLFLRRRK
ncbi:MAG: PEP-CTERM sorting domain-containing protein [Planctomycetota bacterium]|jgi:hypothetical protein